MQTAWVLGHCYLEQHYAVLTDDYTSMLANRPQVLWLVIINDVGFALSSLPYRMQIAGLAIILARNSI
jgi:hypothetical protein